MANIDINGVTIFDVFCAHCLAEPQEKCMTRSGTEINNGVHTARVNILLRQLSGKK